MNKLSKINYCYTKVSKIITCCASVKTKMSIKPKNDAQNKSKMAARILDT